ncbi:hypothetical protein FHX44_111793 [Pseudonocardia hierapolitana]|uniref:Uncharacterized protein n=1 Tax=Pseudonocardia hierapolitana TaxID=1128676 RepID=A0A561SM16_9PSEU|nr:hypothetical protein FHX44_111793 [Pseudonocardia hierapolitana]
MRMETLRFVAVLTLVTVCSEPTIPAEPGSGSPPASPNDWLRRPSGMSWSTEHLGPCRRSSGLMDVSLPQTPR